jgi:predicted nucleic acid-binding protein
VIVVDTNVLAYAVLPGVASALVARVAERDPSWIAPVFWRRELANVLATSMRVRGVKLEDAVAAFGEAERLVTDAEVEPAIAERLEIAQRGGVSAYDAEFVFVAERFDLVLVTGDRKLALAFPGRVQLIETFAAAP